MTTLTVPSSVLKPLQALADHRGQDLDDVALDLLRRGLLANPLPDPSVSVEDLDFAVAEAGAVLASLAMREAIARAVDLPDFTAEELVLPMAAHYGAVLPVPTLAESRAISNLGNDLPLDDDDIAALRSWLLRRRAAVRPPEPSGVPGSTASG